jgi:large subunit ribosomal protein L1
MASSRPMLAQFSRLCLSPRISGARFEGARFLSATAACASKGKIISKKEKAGTASKGQNPQKNKKKDDSGRKKKKARTTYKTYDMKDAEMFSLCDAMRFVLLPFPSPPLNSPNM